MAMDTMPTRIYSSGVFIAYPPFLQALAGFGETDEREKRDNGDDNNNQVKHVIPPRRAADSLCPQSLQSHTQTHHFYGERLLPPGVEGLASGMVWADRPVGETLPGAVGSHEQRKAPPQGAARPRHS